MDDDPEPPASTTDAALEELVFAGLEAIERGGDAALEALCAAHPAHAVALRQRIALLHAIGTVAPGTPERLGAYRLLRRLGQGGMGTVFEAIDVRLQRKVAVKVLRPELLFHDRAGERFRREAMLASRLQHPGICEVFDVGEHDGVAFIAMRLLAGTTLEARIRDDTVGSPAAIATLIEKVARALHAAHEAGLVHRDVKPANIMVGHGGEPVLLDFGLATATDVDLPTLTRSGARLGTLAFMAPELVAGGRNADARSDTYALGVTLYQCLTRRLPFTASSEQELLASIRDREPPAAHRFNPTIPRDLRVVLAKAMAKHPADRYASAGDFADDLRRVVACEPVRARRAGRLLRVRRWAQRNPAIAVLLSLLALGLVATTWSFAAARTTLAEYDQLANVVRLQRAREGVARLFPAWPENAAALQQWLHQHGEPLERALPALRATLADVDARAAPWTEAERQADRDGYPGLAMVEALRAERRQLAAQFAEVDAGAERAQDLTALLADLDAELRTHEAKQARRRTWSFASDEDRFLHQYLERLVDDLDDFVAGDLAQVRAGLAWARSVTERSVERHRDAWQQAIAAASTDDRYRGLQLTPQVGLVPLGPNARGLLEFADLRSASATGAEDGIVFVLVPGGTFTMGSQKDDPQAPNYDPLTEVDEGPPQRVTLAPFLISKFELTKGQWFRLGGGRPSANRAGMKMDGSNEIVTRRHPVENVSQEDCVRLLARHGLELPTEAQWEYACRAGTTTPWSTGEICESLRGAANLYDPFAARFFSSLEVMTWLDDGCALYAPVGSFAPNAFGLHDMHGNVWEWCRDQLLPYGTPVREGDGLRGRPDGGGNRVNRGGAFNSAAPPARSAYRTSDAAGYRSVLLGVRPVRRLR